MMQCSPLAGIILSEKGLDVSIAENCLTLLVGQEVSSAATSVWLNKLRTHINAEDIVCLSSQVLTIYGDESTEAEAGAKLRMLATSAVTGEMTKQALVPSLEVPQFVAGIPAALLTHVRCWA